MHSHFTSKRRLDSNHHEIADLFAELGCSVLNISPLGGGASDLVIGLDMVNVLVEIKRGHAPLSDAEKKFFAEWKGWIAVVRSPEEARSLVDRMKGRKTLVAQS